MTKSDTEATAGCLMMGCLITTAVISLCLIGLTVAAFMAVL